MTRQPTSSGPVWFGRLARLTRSWPSTLKTGTNTNVTRFSTPGQHLALRGSRAAPGSRRPCRRSRRRGCRPASAPRAGPWLRAAAAVRVPSPEATSASSGRSSGVRPNSTQRTCFGQAAANAVHSRCTSSKRPVRAKPDRSATVVSASVVCADADGAARPRRGRERRGRQRRVGRRHHLAPTIDQAPARSPAAGAIGGGRASGRPEPDLEVGDQRQVIRRHQRLAGPLQIGGRRSRRRRGSRCDPGAGTAARRDRCGAASEIAARDRGCRAAR